MLTVNLTEDQLNLLYDLVGEKFNEVAQAWLPAEETEEMNKLSYDTLLNLRAVKYAKKFDNEYPEYAREFMPYDKAEYLKEVHLVTAEALAQQGIAA
jgi:predicted oxidoreductase (fatty acid repression mutant protein)